MGRIKTFYDELGVGRDASVPEIKRAFKEIAKVYHPDKNPPDKQAWAHEQMSRYNFIFETLTHSASRKEYDELVEKYHAG
jgi:DnaJ-class molecular chaperone